MTNLNITSRIGNYLLASLVAATLVVGSSQAVGEGENLYNAGQDALAKGRFEEAIASFRDLASRGDQPDRALYWVAYAEAKAGRKKSALATLKTLKHDHPHSAWYDDAQALEVELKGVDDAGEVPVKDEELKLYALNALHNVQPEKAVQLLQDFLKGQSSPRLRQQALFVLAQIDSPKAAQLLLEIAKDAGKYPGLQRDALQALGSSGDDDAVKALVEIYRASSDKSLKREVFNALIASGDNAAIASLVRTESDPKLVEEGLTALGASGGTEELEALSRTLPASHRGALLQAIGIAGDEALLLKMVRAEKDPARLIDGLEALALVDGDKVQGELLAIYRERSEREVKRAVLNALFVQSSGKALLEIFRQEKDGDLRKEAFQFLTMIDDEDSVQLIEETLKNG